MIKPLDSFQLQALLRQIEQFFEILSRIEANQVRLESKVDKLERTSFNIIQNQGTVGQAISGNEGTQEKHE